MPRKKGTGPNIVRLTPGSKGKVVITESHPVDGPFGPSAVFGGRFVCKDCSKDPCICKHIVQHSSESNEHYTPSDIVERARRLMAVIDLDPASCGEAQEIVKARHMYYTLPNGGAYKPANNVAACIEGDGLAMRPWKGNVFLNPPGGVFKVLNKSFSNAALWWAALVQDWLSGDVKEAVFIGFTLEILRHSQNGCPLPVQAFHRCYPRKRIKYVPPKGALNKKGQPVTGDQPGHANVIVYLPPVAQAMRGKSLSKTAIQNYPDGAFEASLDAYDAFAREFGSLGYCEP